MFQWRWTARERGSALRGRLAAKRQQWRTTAEQRYRLTNNAVAAVAAVALLAPVRLRAADCTACWCAMASVQHVARKLRMPREVYM